MGVDNSVESVENLEIARKSMVEKFVETFMAYE